MNHTPTPWIKLVMHEETRTPEEVASYAGPNAGYVLRAVNAHEELLKAMRKAIKRLRDGDGSDSFFPEQDHEAIEIMEQAIAKGEGK